MQCAVQLNRILPFTPSTDTKNIIEFNENQSGAFGVNNIDAKVRIHRKMYFSSSHQYYHFQCFFCKVTNKSPPKKT